MEKVINYDNDEKNSLKGNCKKVKFVLWIILFANLGVAITKMVVGYLINSASLSTDGIHSLSDGLSNVVDINIKLLYSSPFLLSYIVTKIFIPIVNISEIKLINVILISPGLTKRPNPVINVFKPKNKSMPPINKLAIISDFL